MKRPLAYITAPWSNNQYENTENAAAYCRQVYDAGYSPICPVLFLPTFLKDEIPQEHKDGLDIARDYLRRSHVLVVCGHGIDETVKNDIATADRLRITATKEDLPHLFDRFYRGRRAVGNGIGIGLALARSIFELQNGTITAYNRRNGGACFEIRLYSH